MPKFMMERQSQQSAAKVLAGAPAFLDEVPGTSAGEYPPWTLEDLADKEMMALFASEVLVGARQTHQCHEGIYCVVPDCPYMHPEVDAGEDQWALAAIANPYSVPIPGPATLPAGPWAAAPAPLAAPLSLWEAEAALSQAGYREFVDGLTMAQLADMEALADSGDWAGW